MHVIVFKPGSEKIIAFIKNAIKIDRNFINSQGHGYSACKELISKNKIAYKWVTNEPTPKFKTVSKSIIEKRRSGNIDHNKTLIFDDGFEEKVSDMIEASELGPEITRSSSSDYFDSIDKRKEIATLSFADLNTMLNNIDYTDPVRVKQVIGKIANVLLGHIKISDRHRTE